MDEGNETFLDIAMPIFDCLCEGFLAGFSEVVFDGVLADGEGKFNMRESGQ